MSFQDDEEIENYKFRDPGEDDDAPDEADTGARERQMTKCPRCRKWMLEESPKCPYCKNWVEEERQKGRPRWVVVTAIILLVLCLVFWAMTAHPMW